MSQRLISAAVRHLPPSGFRSLSGILGSGTVKRDLWLSDQEVQIESVKKRSGSHQDDGQSPCQVHTLDASRGVK
jgi:hypothetical protein